MLALVTAFQSLCLRLSEVRHPPRRARPGPGRGQAGQATAEYALVLLAAATVALILLAWATKSGEIEKLFNTVFDALMAKVT